MHFVLTSADQSERMKMVSNLIQGITPCWAKRLIPRAVINQLSEKYSSYYRSLPSWDRLSKLMSIYNVDNLTTVEKDQFKEKIFKFLQISDHEMEDFSNPDSQRDLSIRFHWGHDHDFGDFQLKGRMADRHTSIIATFIDEFKALPTSLEGKKVLDIGCWTGGTSLLLCAMGAQVVAIEEVKKYVDCLCYLKSAFDIQNLEPKHLSLYECTNQEFQDAFDIVLFAGVVYHVTDPVLALRITFNCLKTGGLCLIESSALNTRQRILSYEGPTSITGGSKKQLNRSGWNWFIPSPNTLTRMMADVGYKNIRVSRIRAGRVFAVGEKEIQLDIMRGGLSVREIR